MLEAIKCDCKGCAEKPTLVCACRRCGGVLDDDDEKFHCCDKHTEEAGDNHYRVRGRLAVWVSYGQTD